MPDRSGIGRDLGFQLIVGEQMLQPFGARERAAGDDDPPAVGEPGAAALGERREGAVVAAGCDEGAAEIFLGLGRGVVAALLGDRLDQIEALEPDGLACTERRRDLVGRRAADLRRAP